MSDEKILLAISNKDEAVMSYVIQKYSKLLWKVASSVLVNVTSVQDVEECVAEVFIDFWLNPTRFDPRKGKLSSWLSMVTRSKAIDRYRRVVKKQEVPIEQEVIPYNAGLLTDIVTKEEEEKLLQCIGKLEETDRELVIRRFFYEQKPKEIAVALDMPKKQVENRLYKAKQTLRKMMES